MIFLNQIKKFKEIATISKRLEQSFKKSLKYRISNKNGYMAGAEPFFIYPSTEIGVLLLHGFTSTPAQFLELGEYLAGKGITVYAPLLAGHGTKPEDLAKTTADDWKKSAQLYLDELKEKVKKVIILGNSFGGNMAFLLAIENPEKVSGVISVGTPVWVRAHHWRKYRLFTYGYFQKWWRKPRSFYKSAISQLLDEITYSKIPTSACRHFFSMINHTYKRLKDVKVPTLIIQAENDLVVNSKSALRIHECLGTKDKKICWLNGSYSHSMMEDEKRGQIYKKIYSFVQDQYYKD